MIEYEWVELREHAITIFGDQAPSPELEHDVVQVFAQNPHGVKQAIDYVGGEWLKGKITSPWAILRIQVERLVDNSQNVVATDERTRTKAIEKAEAWIRNAGIHMDREQEIVAYLFGHAEFTPPVEFLEQLEQDTRDNPGRPIYGGLLEAAIERTRTEGVQQIPGTQDGPLLHYKTTKLRDRMVTLWRESRHLGEQVEAEALERAEQWKTSHGVTPKPSPHPQTKAAT